MTLSELQAKLAEQEVTIARLEPLAQRWETAEAAAENAIRLVGTLQTELAERDATIEALEQDYRAEIREHRLCDVSLRDRDATITRLREHAKAVMDWYPNRIEEGEYLTASAANALNALRALAEQPS